MTNHVRDDIGYLGMPANARQHRRDAMQARADNRELAKLAAALATAKRSTLFDGLRRGGARP